MEPGPLVARGFLSPAFFSGPPIQFLFILAQVETLLLYTSHRAVVIAKANSPTPAVTEAGGQFTIEITVELSCSLSI